MTPSASEAARFASRLARRFSYPFIPAAVNTRPGLGDAHLKHARRLAKLDLPHLAQVQSALLGLLASTAAAVAPEPAPALASLLLSTSYLPLIDRPAKKTSMLALVFVYILRISSALDEPIDF